MDYLALFIYCFFGAFFIRTLYIQCCKKEAFIFYVLICSLIEQKKIIIKDNSGKELTKKRLYDLLEIKEAFAEKIWFGEESTWR